MKKKQLKHVVTACKHCGKRRRNSEQDSELCPGMEDLVPVARVSSYCYGGHVFETCGLEPKKESDKKEMNMIVNLKKSSPLYKNLGTKLYILEDVMGESCGHGCGLGGEDIDWTVKEKEDYYTLLAISNDGEDLEITYRKWKDQIEEKEDRYDELNLTDLPKKWQTRLLKVLSQHTRKRSLKS